MQGASGKLNSINHLHLQLATCNLHFQMPVEKWSDSIALAHLGTEPHFSEEIETLMAMTNPSGSAVLDFSAVHYVNSSNIAHLLRLRQQIHGREGRLILCNLAKSIWSTFLVTGLDKIFEFSDDVPTALAMIQIKESADAEHPPED